MTPEPRPANRLIREKSPYLLQHAYNPVDWYPWGEAAFQRARTEQKPVFLSVGYSTCYWCHVMERESFEDPDVAALLNAHFVAIKVDREERPDVDTLYMRAVQAMTGQGGWPMSVFLTPEGQPFYGGTYFPPDDRYGRPGFKALLQAIHGTWEHRRDQVVASSHEITQALTATAPPSEGGAITEAVLAQAAEWLGRAFDADHGGFGGAPKFPQAHSLSFLLRRWARTREARVLEMVETTLAAMAHGGVHDHLGGGFHRYATDARWLVPHFEKMLYDQALLARAYLEAFQITRTAEYSAVARGIFTYVFRDLQDPGGAFYAAEDAGEVGQEGVFYTWTPEEVDQVLPPVEARLARRVLGISEGGHVEHGRSVVHLAQPLEMAAKLEGLDPEAARAQLQHAREALLAARSQRPRPHRDDKILTDWNGLMIGALAVGARVLDEPRYAQAAEQAAAFLLTTLRRDGQLFHRYRDGEVAISGFLDDYAFLSWGLLELYEATFDPRWLEAARSLVQEMDQRFWDAGGRGYFLNDAAHGPLLARVKEAGDGALPSGNSVAALVLQRLGELTQDRRWTDRAAQVLLAFAEEMRAAPHGYLQGLMAVDQVLGPPQEIMLVGDPADAGLQAMVREVRGRFLPRAAVVLRPTGPAGDPVTRLVPFLRDYHPVRDQPTAFVCHNYVCTLPVTDRQGLAAQLDQLGP